MVTLLKEMPKPERPREKAFQFGVSYLSNVELLALLLRHGYAEHSALDVAATLLQAANGVGGLGRMTLQRLTAIKGIKQVKALELLASFELAKRMAYEKCREETSITHPKQVVTWLRLTMGSLNQEQVRVLYLNTANRIVTTMELYRGTVDASPLACRDLIQGALECHASKLILIHNHPSGEPTPSLADRETTKKVQEACAYMDLTLVDHLIVTQQRYFSFLEEGLLDQHCDAERKNP